MGLRDKLRDLKDKVLEKMLEEQFVQEVTQFMSMSKFDQDYYNELLKYKANLHKNYSYCSNDPDLEEIIHNKIVDVNKEIDYYNKRMREVVA